MNVYRQNKLAAKTYNNEPSLTDQAGARDTDINVIVAQFGIHGQVPGLKSQPIYADFTDMPTDLRGFLELGRSIEDHRARLPDALKDFTTDELLALTPAELRNILTPPAEKPADQVKDQETTK